MILQPVLNPSAYCQYTATRENHPNINPIPERESLSDANRVRNVVAPPGFNPRTSRTPAPDPAGQAPCVTAGQRFLAHLGVPVMT